MGLDACVRVEQAYAAGTYPDPADVKECKRWRLILDSIRWFYLIKFFPSPFPPPGPIGVIPEVGWLAGDPTPQPSIFARTGIQDLLLGELFLDVLKGNPSPQPNIPSLFDEIRESGAQIRVVNSLLKQFEDATEYLKQEREVLEQAAQHSR
jgi:hypothetical protein